MHDGTEREAPGRETAYTVRAATRADAPILAYQRRAMFEATGLLAADDGPALERAVRGYLDSALADGTFVAWVVRADGRHDEEHIVAGGGIQLRSLMPRPGHLDGAPEALIVSMWTEPAHRRRGLGTRVLDAMLAWCRARGIRRLMLHASSDGRPLYAGRGFKATNEMRLELTP